MVIIGDEVIVNKQIGVVIGIFNKADKTYFISTIDGMTYIRRSEEVIKTDIHHTEIDDMFDSIKERQGMKLTLIEPQEKEAFPSVDINSIGNANKIDIDEAIDILESGIGVWEISYKAYDAIALGIEALKEQKKYQK